MKASRQFVCGLLCIFATLQAYAWGPLGHQTVGKLADQLIAGSNAEKAVKRILGSSLMTVSVWADCAKGAMFKADGTYAYPREGLYAECKPFETASGEQQLIDFVSRNGGKECTANADDEQCVHKTYHYTDVSALHDHYDARYFGTSKHDIVAAIGACIAVLQDKPSPPPFRIKSKREALRLLAHYMGDLHQPLHVVAVYLDPNGKQIDPAQANSSQDSNTRGGNEIMDGSTRLHSEWDALSDAMSTDVLAALEEARAVGKTPGAITSWPAAWAGDTINNGRAAFKGLTFSKRDADGNWHATHASTYSKERRALQRAQLIKAGARFAQLLQAIWP